MKALKELAKLVKQHRLEEVALLGDQSGETSRMGEFYEALVQNKFDNEDEAAAYFYGSDRNYSGYQKLKAKTRNLLLNHVFFLNENKSQFSDRERAYFKCYRYWAAAKILLGLYRRNIGIQIAEQVLKLALTYEFSDLVMDVAKTLRIIYGTREGNQKKFEEYNNIYKEYQQISYYEDLAEEYYTELSISFVNEKSNNAERRQKADLYYQELAPFMKKYDSYRLHLSGNLIRSILHTSVNDYTATIDICDEAIRFFEKKHYTARLPLQIFYYQLIVCHTQLKQYAAGKKAAERCLRSLEEGSFNWFKYQELYFILSMHTRNYQQAYRVFVRTTSHRQFARIPDNLKEIWKIYEAFLQVLYHLGKVKEEGENDHLSRFRFGRFINATPIFTRDKRGMNIPILVAQIMTLIIHRKYGQVIDRIEAIERYCSRYLTKDGTYRSNCFIKMLLQIPTNNFHAAAVKRKTAKYVRKLKQVPLDVAQQNHEIEIIPYEELWNLLLGSLDNNFHYAKAKRSQAQL